MGEAYVPLLQTDDDDDDCLVKKLEGFLQGPNSTYLFGCLELCYLTVIPNSRKT